MRRPLVAGNWKMHGTRASIATLVAELSAQAMPTDVDVAVFPGLIHLQTVLAALADCAIVVGSQDCAVQMEEGALTGETSALQLQDLGCSMVIVGHSERRQLQEENDGVICRKFIAAQAAGLTPILCVGETLAEREAGQTEAVVKRQLAAVIQQVGQCVSELVVAYEPVWAIGTGKTATPEQAQQVHAVLRAQLAAATEKADRVPLLYGGSMNAANAEQLLAQADIDGGLIGGAALKAPDFLTIIAAAQ